MTDKKFTDNEIKKALECCADKDEKMCHCCPLFKDRLCLEHLSESSLDLINRQQAKIKEFDEKLVIQKGFIDSQNAEIGRLQNTLDDVLDRQPKLVANAEKYIVEEFADKITDRASAVQVGNLSWVWQISQDDIDDVKKEVLGEE